MVIIFVPRFLFIRMYVCTFDEKCHITSASGIIGVASHGKHTQIVTEHAKIFVFFACSVKLCMLTSYHDNFYATRNNYILYPLPGS